MAVYVFNDSPLQFYLNNFDKNNSLLQLCYRMFCDAKSATSVLWQNPYTNWKFKKQTENQKTP